MSTKNKASDIASKTLWSGRFKASVHDKVQAFNASIHFDQRLVALDLIGSMAHVKMLGQCQLIEIHEAKGLQKGLLALLSKAENNALPFLRHNEDVHMNNEYWLKEEMGSLAGKLHMGRSRNDQVALDLHLYLREQTLEIIHHLLNVQEALLTLAQRHQHTCFPGYTHLQRAQPIRFAHHLLAYVQMFMRDIKKFQESYARLNTSPLGAGALAGSGFHIDGHITAQALNLDQCYLNSLDAVSNRDYIVEFLSHCALLMIHISRLSEELIIWNSHEFSFIEFEDQFCTGSSMMPQKKNPDVAELSRGKSGRVIGALMGMLTVLKALPLAYNKDLQEDKEGLFDTAHTVVHTLELFALMLPSIKVNTQKINDSMQKDFSNATLLANDLCEKGIPFRKAHEITGQIVLYCIENSVELQALSLQTLQSFCEHFSEDIFEKLTIEHVIESQRGVGGTHQSSICHQIHTSKTQLHELYGWYQEQFKKIDRKTLVDKCMLKG